MPPLEGPLTEKGRENRRKQEANIEIFLGATQRAGGGLIYPWNLPGPQKRDLQKGNSGDVLAYRLTCFHLRKGGGMPEKIETSYDEKQFRAVLYKGGFGKCTLVPVFCTVVPFLFVPSFRFLVQSFLFCTLVPGLGFQGTSAKTTLFETILSCEPPKLHMMGHKSQAFQHPNTQYLGT